MFAAMPETREAHSAYMCVDFVHPYKHVVLCQIVTCLGFGMGYGFHDDDRQGFNSRASIVSEPDCFFFFFLVGCRRVVLGQWGEVCFSM